jgi:hypothetical protein
MSVGPATLTHLLAGEQPRHGASQPQAQQSSQWFESDPVLCVYNLARSAQAVQLDLQEAL